MHHIQKRSVGLFILCLLAAALGIPSVAKADEPKPAAAPESPVKAYPETMNKKFVDPKANVDGFVHKFENEDREVYAKREEIVRAAALSPGQRVADIGAGTGLFTFLFAEKVGPSGGVYAVDIGPAFIDYIDRRAKELGKSGVVKTVLNRPESTGLAPGSIDVAFVCNTYHHFDRPEAMLASIRRALRPEGRLIVVDFDLRPDASEFVKKRARATRKEYEREILAAGFTLAEVKTPPVLKDNFYIEFRKSAEESK